MILVCWFDAVDEIDALDDFGEVGEAAQPAPAFLGTLSKLEHHVQHAIAAETAFRALCPVTDGGEGTLDRV